MGERAHTKGLIDLSHFCYTEDDGRSYLKQPWSRGGFTYATNGHVMVRVPRRADVPDNEAAPDGERVLKNLSFDDLRPIKKPLLPPLRFFLVEGDGLLSPQYSALDSECARFAGALFNLRYVHLLCWLPDLTVGPAADEFSPTPFGFAGGGVGCLMPMKEIKDQPPHYDFGGLPAKAEGLTNLADAHKNPLPGEIAP